jgi:hypothetical protein
MSKQITITQPNGASDVFADTAENRALASEKGFAVEEKKTFFQSAKQTIGEAAQGIDEAIGSHDATAYNPLLWAERGAAKAIAGIAGAKPTKELDEDAKQLLVKMPDGQQDVFADTIENRKLAKERGFQVENISHGQQGTRGAVKAYLESAGNEIGFGIPRMAMSDEEKREFDETQNLHSTAGGMGAVAGFAAQSMMPGLNMAKPVALAEKGAAAALAKLGIEAGTTSVAGKAVQTAAKWAAGGVAYSAPRALGQAVYEDTGAAAETLLAGGAFGAIIGGGGSLGASLIGKSKNALIGLARHNGLTPELQTMKMLGLERGSMNKMGGVDEVENSGRVIMDALGDDIRSASKDALFEKVGTIETKAGETIGQIIKQGSEAGVATNTFSVGKVAESIYAAMPGSGPLYQKEMNMTYKAIGQAIQDATGEAAPRFKGSLEDKLKQIVEHANTLEPVSLEAGQQFKRKMNEAVNKIGNKKTWNQMNDADHLTKQIHTAVRDELSEAVGRFAEVSQQPELKSLYDVSRNQYRAVKQIEEMMQKSQGREVGNNLLGPSSINLISSGITGAVASANPMGILYGAGAAAGRAIMGSTAVRSNMVYYGDKLLRAKAGEHVMNKFAEMETVFERLAARTANAYTDNRKIEEPGIPASAQLIGSTTKDPKKALQEYKDLMDPLMKNPEKLQERLSSIHGTIAQAGDPQLADAWMNKQMAALDYIHSKVPGYSKKVPDQMFYNREYVPSAAEIKTFNEVVACAMDPFYIVRKIEDGTLKQDHIDAVDNLYPQLGQMIRARIESMGYEQQAEEKRPNLPYDVRTRLERLTKAETQAKAARMRNLQNNFKTENAKKDSSNTRLPQSAKAQNLATDVEKLS